MRIELAIRPVHETVVVVHPLTSLPTVKVGVTTKVESPPVWIVNVGQFEQPGKNWVIF